MTEQFSTPALEIKSTGNGNVAEAFDEFMHSFEAFRQHNDDRLKQIEKRANADVLTHDKVERINHSLDEQKRIIDHMLLKKARPALDTGVSPLLSLEHKNAFDNYVRRGDEHGVRSIEAKAMSIGSAPDGGYLVPPELERDIGTRLALISPIRALATVRQVSSSVLKKPFSVEGPAVGWVGETDARPQTEASKLTELQFQTMELYAMPAATSSLLDDAAVDVEQWISAEVETAFAEQEGQAFINGDGINRPKGFLSYDSVPESEWSWGKLGGLSTGVTGAFPAADASDILLDTIYALKAGYRQNASWVMNRKTQAAVRKLKDNDGNYLWTPPAAPGQQASLLGFRLTEAEGMPDISSKTAAIAFGDFARGYLVVDRTGVRVLRDPYSAKPYVLFYTTKRVGGGVQDFDAIKLLKFAA
ncbi:phage major capsid protein [Phyllobacterium sp. 628]|uniref:phage major capsid protein n=1 Tax=Phyllobacterium sp. 628 TaxID=2718938 RepID=UPI0016621F6E|nr:phage major capsid protein [Phyllobacterium sp. 628]QND52395.1 phage major capsid protein [Phyllobacterium sp. 628]